MVVKVFATFREIVSGKEVLLDIREGQTIRELLTSLIDKYPAFRQELFDADERLRQHVHVFVNGKNIIHGNGLDTILSATDEVALIPPVGGG
ncbi:ubiquitin-like small modifier protein 1 [Effusibacillus lacus]|uniref:Molybdopterin synthase sulfur carrier subunit n=1 Tax=Effusibacillus lacus TaxID=1348429 RepID=A0A292YJV6_9BACL|nr:ubiquitin-like small modifier protein 1 [Effusibacillus lacus]TCS69424.1 molybdopterin synthase sulfur carrier subunit [Effusibacillus lacus]GAX89191.1 molybdopterin synthase sulfur carrier subunit [Effusibacillus lacus]